MSRAKSFSSTRIYLDCLKLFNLLIDITPSFPRVYKFSIGSEMHQLSVKLITHISATYTNRDTHTRIQCLVDFQSEFEVLKTLIRVAGERKWIAGKNKHADIIEILDAIDKQSTAWKNSLIKLNSASNSEQIPESHS